MATSGDGGPGEGGGDAAGPDGSASDAGVVPSVVLALHASPDLFDFRICLATSTSADGTGATFSANVAPWPSDDSRPMPMANYAGVAVGRGAALPREIVPSGVFVVPYLIDAHQLAMSNDPKAACSSRVGSGCVPGSGMCLKSSDFVQLPAIPAVTFAGTGAKLLAIVGCLTPGRAACGAEDNGALHAKVLPLAGDEALSVDQIGVQVAHVALAAGSVVAHVDDTTIDAGPLPLDPFNVGPLNGFVMTVPSDKSSPLWASEGVSFAIADAGLRMSLADMQRIADPSQLPIEFFKAHGAYVFVLVGDPNAANALYVDGGLNPKFDGTGLHVTAISTSPGTLGGGG